MKRLSVIALALLGIAGVFVAGSWHGRNAAREDASPAVRKVLYYVDPMNAMNRYDRPGKAPCGMDLEPVYEDDGEDPAIRPTVPGTVRVGIERQQLIGVRTDEVRKAAGTYTLRATGRVVPDETRLYRINASIDGRITRMGDQTVGSSVRKNEALAAYFTPEILKVGRAVLAYQGQIDRGAGFGTQRYVGIASVERPEIYFREQLDSLRDLGMGEPQIEEMIRTRTVADSVDLVSPVNGFVLARNVSDGQLFTKGAELYRIVDLSRVWILADVYEDEVVHLRPGMKVRFSLPRQGRWKQARVSDALPQFDPDSRTMKVRLETDNRKLELRPDMYVDIEIPVRYPAAVVVAADAVNDSGIRKTVYVERGNGYFEPRSVETGWRHGERVEIVSGLSPGERIVLSANFLIDSESKLRASAEGIFGTSHLDPVCGMHVDEGKARAAGRTAEHGGTTYFFCADSCREKFLKGPEKYTGGNDGKTAAKPEPAVDRGSDATPAKGKPSAGKAMKSPSLAKDYVAEKKPPGHDTRAPAVRTGPGTIPGKQAHPPAPGMAGMDGSRKGQAGHGMPVPEIAPGAETAVDPVCGMQVDTARTRTAGLVSEYEGTAYYFCNGTCKHVFDRAPAPFHRKQAAAVHRGMSGPPDSPMVPPLQGSNAGPGMAGMDGSMKGHAGHGMPAPEIAPGAETAVDPVCNMTVDTTRARTAGLVSEHGGSTYYFCVESCKQAFDKTPETFLRKGEAEEHHGKSGTGSSQ